MDFSLGRYDVQIIAADPLSGVCVVHATDPKAVEHLQEAHLARTLHTQGQAMNVIPKTYYLQKKQTMCALWAEESFNAHPAQNILMHKGVGSYKDGTVLFNDAGAIMSLWLQKGWITLSCITAVVEKARRNMDEGRRSLGEAWAIAGVCFGYISKQDAQTLLGKCPYNYSDVLFVSSVGCGIAPTGLEPGDVIVRMNGVDVAGDYERVMGVLRSGDQGFVGCELIRYGKLIEVQVPLTRIKEEWQPFFVLKDMLLFPVNQRLSFEYNVPEGSLILVWGAPNRHPFILCSINGKSIGYSDLEVLSFLKEPYRAPFNIMYHPILLQAVSYRENYPLAPWFVRRVDLYKP